MMKTPNLFDKQIMKPKKLIYRNLYNKKFFREFDVWHHIKPNDFWLILNRRVLDLSHLVKMIDELPNNITDSTVSNWAHFCAFVLCDLGKIIIKWKICVFLDFTLQALHQLSMFGGSDVSDLFSKRQQNKLEMFQLKSSTAYGKLNGCFWWNDPVYIIGSITTRERHICVRNKTKGELAKWYFEFNTFTGIYCESENLK